MWGLSQIPGHGESAAFLLQSKVARHGSRDHYISDVETPRFCARRHPAILGRRDGASAVFRDFASIVPHVVRMEPGFALVTVPKWFFVKRVEVVPLTGFPAGTRFVPQRQPALGDILPQTAEIQATSSTFRLWQALPRRVRMMRGERSPRIATA